VVKLNDKPCRKCGEQALEISVIFSGVEDPMVLERKFRCIVCGHEWTEPGEDLVEYQKQKGQIDLGEFFAC